MPRFNIGKYTKRFSKEERQKRLETRLNRQLEQEKRHTERYLALHAEDERINKLKKEIGDYRSTRGANKKSRRVKIGGFRFEI